MKCDHIEQIFKEGREMKNTDESTKRAGETETEGKEAISDEAEKNDTVLNDEDLDHASGGVMYISKLPQRVM